MLDADRIAQQFEEDGHRIRGSGGEKYIDFNSVARRKQRAEARKAEKTNRLKRAKVEKLVRKVVLGVWRLEDGSEEEKMIAYKEWVVRCLGGSPVLKSFDFRVNNSEIEWDSFTSSVHAGGSGKDTANTANRATHVVSGISSESQKRLQGGNREMAGKLLKNALETHIELWRRLIDGVPAELRGQEVARRLKIWA